jgi:uncharacterized protein
MLTILLGALVGLALGLTGGGGSIFAVPLLIYVLDIQPQLATTMSLAAVAAMAGFGAIEASINKMVEWRASLILILGGIICAPLGVIIASRVSESFIVIGFTVLMLLVATSMWYRVSKRPDQAAVVRVNYQNSNETDGAICQLNDNQDLRLSAPCSAVLLISGCVTGVLSGLFGVGGGFLIVPILTTVTQLGIHRAVASSLLIITLIGISGVGAAFLQGRTVEFAITGLFILGGLVGMIGGRLIAKQIPALLLQKVFALGIFVIALITLFIDY